jgi:Serine/threonine protein phosphatase
LEEHDKFIIIASDGVWEFLTNQQVVNMIAPYYLKNQLEAACDKVIKEATNRWKHVMLVEIIIKYVGG